MTVNASGSDPSALYTLAIAIVLASVLMSASVYFAAGNLGASLEKGIALGNANNGAVVAAPSPSPSPSAAPSPSPAPAGQPVKVDVSGRPVQGPATAKVTIVEFSDYQCPFCRTAEPTVTQVMKDYAGKVKLVYMNFPLSFHPYAQKAAEAAECANAQGKFWEMHDQLFQDSQQLDVPSIKAAAVTLGLDATKFNACLDGGQMASLVGAQASAGSTYGVGGTPTFFINGKPLVGAQPYATFKSAIDAALAS